MEVSSIPDDQPAPSNDSRILPVDTEHGGIRLALPFLTIVGFIVGYIVTAAVLNAIAADSAVGCFSFLAAIGAALGFAIIGDYILKRIWPSGRRLIIDG